MLSICLNFLINFFTYVVTGFFVCLWHPIHINLKFLLLSSDFVTIFFFLVKVIQMLFSFAIFTVFITKDWFLRVIIFKIEIVKSLIFLVLIQTFAEVW